MHRSVFVYKLLINARACLMDCFLKANAVNIIYSIAQPVALESGTTEHGEVHLRISQIHR